MKRIITTLFCVSFLIACQNNKKPTLSKEEQETQLAEAKFAEIDLSQVDVYPSFSQCADTLSQEDLKKCFETNLSYLYKDVLQKHHFAIGEPLNDVVQVYLKIDNQGHIIFERTECSDNTRNLLPKLDSLLAVETQSFEPIIPAQKHEINVSTQCILPLVINVP